MVGIGASAGALEPLEQLFSHMAADSGFSFVVVQHLERHQPSVLAELLGKHTRMPVEHAVDGARPRPNHVYVIPPNATLTLERGLLRVTTPSDTGLRSPIDLFFRSLAVSRGEAAVGIILSGTGTDGTSGLRAIKEHAGLTLAQAPETAKYDGMPASAIEAGFVDVVLSVEEMPARLEAYRRQLDRVRRRESDRVEADVAAHLQRICEVLLQRTGHDFGRYKPGTLIRRIARRLRVREVDSAAEYIRLLEQDAEEAGSLVRDLSIAVTQFFRDADAFEALGRVCLPAILDRGDPGTPVRIWVPGCASGEEAYSIAMLVLEYLSLHQLMRSVRIFATDIDGELVAAARNGRYSDGNPRARLAGARGAVLRPGGRDAAGREGTPGDVHVLGAQPDQGPAVFLPRPHLVSERPHLPGDRSAGEARTAVSLRPPPRGLPAPGIRPKTWRLTARCSRGSTAISGSSAATTSRPGHPSCR